MASNLIGLLGGTFDPIHLGHIHLALSCAHALDLAEVRLIPAGQPLLRESPLVNAKQRLAMVERAVENHPRLTVDTLEIERENPSYAIDTLRLLRSKMPDSGLCYIIGVDQFAQFNRWHEWWHIPQLAHVVVTTRPGHRFRMNRETDRVFHGLLIQDPQLLSTRPAGYIIRQNIVPLPISATAIRTQLATGKHPNIYLDPKVEHYISENHLYRSE